MIFQPITRPQFAKIANKVSSLASISIDEDSGKASNRGFTISWSYSEIDETLVVSVMHKPFWASESLIEDKIKALVNDAEPETQEQEPETQEREPETQEREP